MLHFRKSPQYKAHYATLPPLGHQQISIKTYGNFVSQGNFSWEQVSPQTCLHLITEGSGTFVSQGHPYTAQKGTLFIFFKGDHIKYYDDAEQPWKYRWCSIVGPIIEVLRQCGIESHQPVHHLMDLDKVISALDALEFSCKNDVPDPHLGNVALHSILHQLNNPHPNLLDKAQKAKELIDSSTYDVPSVQEISDSLSIDRSTLFRSFKKKYGLSVKQYLDQRRLNKAASLLEVSNENISSIALSCGYHDPLYFSRAFRKHFSTSPRDYREQSQSKPTKQPFP